jgi:hypothetical protein
MESYDSTPTSNPRITQRGPVEAIVEKEMIRRRRLLYAFSILLFIPLVICLVFLRYGRTDRVLVTREVKQEFAPVQGRLVSAEKATSDLHGELSETNTVIQATQSQAKRASELAVAAQQTNRVIAEQLKTEMSKKASTADVHALDNRVQVVGETVHSLDSSVVSVRVDLNATREDLKMARTELGTLVARNHDEVEQLRRLGARDYIEFAMPASRNTQKVGPIAMGPVHVNSRKNQFSAVVGMSDKRLELDRRSLDEVIYLHVANSTQAIELVVTQLSKDKIAGYLSIPKSLSSAQEPPK